jgi:hypothetical protein
VIEARLEIPGERGDLPVLLGDRIVSFPTHTPVVVQERGERWTWVIIEGKPARVPTAWVQTVSSWPSLSRAPE